MYKYINLTISLYDNYKENNLQNPLDRREILCDEALEKVLKKKKVNMFKMTKIISTVSYSSVYHTYIHVYYSICSCMHIHYITYI